MKRLNNGIEGEKHDKYPIWFMRQAGRYLPEFRKIRKNNPNFINLCLNEKLITKISLQPLKRYDLDAVIIFSDILVIPFGLGQNVLFKKNIGPKLDNLVLDKIINTNKTDFVNKIYPIYKAITKVKNSVSKNKSIIGFVGAPWTLLIYMINRESPKNNTNINKIIKNKIMINKLLSKLEEIICLHIDKQIDSGANVIQIFDSWAGLLPKEKLLEYCYLPNLKIVEHVKKKNVPVICFPKGIKKNYVNFCSIVKPSCISIDYEVDPKWIKSKIKGRPIQGGIDPKILLTSKSNIRKKINKYLNIFKDYPYVFNLGHGILPTTKPEIIDYVVKLVRSKKK